MQGRPKHVLKQLVKKVPLLATSVFYMYKAMAMEQPSPSADKVIILITCLFIPMCLLKKSQLQPFCNAEHIVNKWDAIRQGRENSGRESGRTLPISDVCLAGLGG